MLKNISEVFAVKEVALENMDLLPETLETVIYFVTATQEKSKNFFYIAFTSNLRKKFKKHNREVEFEFLNKIGYQINIFWLVLPKGITQREAQAVEMCYKRALERKLNDEENSLFKIQAEESRKQFENWEQWRYEYLKKQIENWEQSGDDKDTIIKKIWELCKEPFGDKRLNSVGT
jgi:predicted GIY-YIG superfamily endonuclease